MTKKVTVVCLVLFFFERKVAVGVHLLASNALFFFLYFRSVF